MANPYIQILIESLEKKDRVLDEVIKADDEQMKMVQAEKPDMEALDASIKTKSALVDELNSLDDGFESVYEKVKDDLLNHKDEHRDDIRRLQELISKITEKSVKIEAAETRNKQLVETYFRVSKKKIKDSRNSVKIANAYAVNMHRINKIDSFFVDNKK